MSEMGRPRTLDDVKRREIIALISTGYGMPGAAKYIGCAPNTIRREARRDAEFGQQLRDAEKQARLRPLKAIRRKAHTHWRAAAWLLERTEPEKYGKKDNRLPKPADVDGLLDSILQRLMIELRLDPALEFIVETMARSAKAHVMKTSAARPDKNHTDRMIDRSMEFFAESDRPGEKAQD